MFISLQKKSLKTMRKSPTAKLSILFFLFLAASTIFQMFWIGNGLAQQIVAVSPRMTAVRVTWDANHEADLSHYIVNFYGNKIDTSYSTSDTTFQVFIPDSLKYDSLYCFVEAVDLAGNESMPSRKIVCIPDRVNFDFFSDNNRRIDIEDLREILKKYHDYNAKTTWRYVEE